MRVLDDKNRLFGVINPVDLIVLVAIVVALLVAASFLFSSKQLPGAPKLHDVEYTLVIPSVTNFKPGYVTPGDIVSKLGSGVLGTVQSVSSTPARVESMRADGGRGTYESAIYRDITLTMRGKGEATPLGFILGGIVVRNNTRISIGTPRFEGTNASVRSLKAVD